MHVDGRVVQKITCFVSSTIAEKLGSTDVFKGCDSEESSLKMSYGKIKKKRKNKKAIHKQYLPKLSKPPYTTLTNEIKLELKLQPTSEQRVFVIISDIITTYFCFLNWATRIKFEPVKLELAYHQACQIQVEDHAVEDSYYRKDIKSHLFH